MGFCGLPACEDNNHLFCHDCNAKHASQYGVQKFTIFKALCKDKVLQLGTSGEHNQARDPGLPEALKTTPIPLLELKLFRNLQR